jgi:hypothetical protein
VAAEIAERVIEALVKGDLPGGRIVGIIKPALLKGGVG